MTKSVRFLAAVVAGIAIAGCGGNHDPAVPGRHQEADGHASPCRGVDPWTGDALRRCRALVGQWAPVHSLHLSTDIPQRVRSTCARARQQVGIAVVCPPVVPTGGVISDPNLYGAETRGSAGDFYLLTFNNGENGGYIHWIVGAGWGRTVENNLFDPRQWDVPGDIRPLGKRRLGAWTVSFYRFPSHPSGGPLGGHDVAVAKVGNTTYFATVHGHSHRDADAAMLLAILLTVKRISG
jgi:hypothetical protein